MSASTRQFRSPSRRPNRARASLFRAAGPSVEPLESRIAPAVGTLAVGNQVFIDLNGNNTFDAGDTGVEGVSVNLYLDNGVTVGAFDASDTLLSTTTTGAGGVYGFTGLLSGDYIVQLPQSNFNVGSVLAGALPIASAADPDNNVDHDNNGMAAGGSGVVSLPITLANGTEPSGAGNDANQTLDFGFITGKLSTTLVGGNLTITDTGDLNNTLTVKLVNGGNDLEITDSSQSFSGVGGIGVLSNGNHTLRIPKSSVTGSITLNTAGGNDGVILDLTGGDFINAAGLDFNGGNSTSTPNDSLAISGGAQGTVTYSYTNITDGSVVMSNFGTVRYTGSELNTNTGAATDVIHNLPGIADNTISLEDNGATPTDGMLRLRSSLSTFGQTDFALPTNSLTFNLGANNQTFTLSATPQLASSLTINGGQGDDIINLNSAATFAANKNLNVDLQDDDATPGTDTITFSTAANYILSGTGAVTLKTSKNIQILGHIATENGNIVMEANQQAVPTAASFIGINISGASAVVESTGTGAITLLGKGGNSTSNHGVQVINNGSTVRGGSVPGGDSVTIVGQGVAGTTSIGAFIPNGDIFTLAGDIRITGRGFGTGAGSQIQNGSTIQPAANGNVYIDVATQNPTGAVAALNMLNIGTVATGIYTTGTGTVNIIADSFALQTVNTLPPVIDAGTSTVYIRPKTPGHNIDIGSTGGVAQAGVLDISDAELDRITAGTIQIGDANSGTINITNVISPASYKTLSLGKSAAFTTGATTGGFDAEVFSGTDYEKIRVAGTLTIDPAATLNVTAAGGYVPNIAHSFKLIENTSANPTTGTFSGKPDGTQISVGGINKPLRYAVGAGANDVILVGMPTDLTITNENVGNDDNLVPGETVTYSLQYSNAGTSAASGVKILENLPAGTSFNPAENAGWSNNAGVLTFNIGSLAAGASGSTTLVLHVLTPAAAGQSSIVSTATITDDIANDPDIDLSNNSATDTDTLIAAPDLAITNIENSGNDDRVDPGETIVYTINYANNGNQGATNVLLTDNLPAGTSFVAGNNPGWTNNAGVLTFNVGSLAAGATGSATLSLVVANPPTAGQIAIINTASISDDDANGADPSGNDSATDTDLLQAADLAITGVENTDNSDELLPGDTVVYQISYANNGNTVATGVVLTNNLPDGTSFSSADNPGWTENAGVLTYSLGSLTSGASGTIALHLTVNETVAAGIDAIANTASISDDGTHGNDTTANNSGTDTDTLQAAPDLVLLSLDSNGQYTQPGEYLTYSIVYANYGKQDATGVYLTIALPEGTTFSELENSGWTLDGSTLFYTVGDLDADASDSATLVLHVDDPLANGITSITGTATIADDDANGDDAYDDESATDSTPVLTHIPVSISLDGKTARFTEPDGDAITVKISAGKLEASNFIVTNLGFAQLDLTDFGVDGLSFAGSRVSITAKRTAAGGDGLVNLGYLNATGLDLGAVTINGDLARIDAGDADPATPALTSLTVYSMGMFEEATRETLHSPSLDSTIVGGVTSMRVRGDVRGISWTVTGGASADMDRIAIGGSMDGAAFTLDGALRYLAVSGNIVDSDIAVSEDIGKLTPGLREGSYKLNGGISVKGSIQDSIITTDGILSQLRTGGSYVNSTRSSGSLIHSTIAARGNLNPTTDLEAKAVGLISIGGIVDHSQILVGYNQEGDAVNPDVQVGKLFVGTDWLGSDLAIGVEAGDDGEFATSDDTLIAGGNPAIISSLGSGIIRGYFLEEVDASENSGIAAEFIGKFRAGSALLTPSVGLNGIMGLGVAHSSSSPSDEPISPTISKDGRSVTFVDVDGDIVRIQATLGEFTESNFLIVPMAGGVAGGGQLAELNLSNGASFAGASIIISAKPGPLGGNGFVNVGYLNATGIDLFNVTVKGDLGRIDAGDENESTQGVGTVSAQSMGVFGLATQPTFVDANLDSHIVGSAANWRIGGDVLDVDINVSGKVGRFLVGGSMLFSTADFGATIDLAGIRGDMIVSSFRSEGSVGQIINLTTPGIGGWTVAGDMIASELAVNGDVSRLGIGGSLLLSHISVRGDAVGTTDALEAQTIGSLTVKGGVELSYIAVGSDIGGEFVNADVQVGKVLIGTHWTASSLSVGTTPGEDQFYGTEDDSLLPGAGVSPIVARVASLVVKGHVNGGGYIPEGRFGFVAEEFGSARVGNTVLPLTSARDVFQLSPFSDVVLQEALNVNV